MKSYILIFCYIKIKKIMIGAGGNIFEQIIGKRIISGYLTFLLLTAGFILVFTGNDCINQSSVAADSEWLLNSITDFEQGTFTNTTTIGTGSDPGASLQLKPKPEWENLLSLDAPKGRISKIANVFGTQDILLFGGYKITSLGDTWTYNYTTNIWINKRPKYTPGYREDYVMAPIYGTDLVLLFDGTEKRGYNTIYYNDTWIYDLSDNNWIKISTSETPNVRSGSAMASIDNDDKVVLYCHSYNKLTWIFDLSENEWTDVTPSRKKADQLYDYSLTTIYGTDKVLFYGGKYTEPTIQPLTMIYYLSENTEK